MIEIKEITPEIYELRFDTDELMFKHLLRYSECIESSSKKFFNKNFSYAEVLINHRRETGKDYRDTIVAYNFPVGKLEKTFTILDNFTYEEKFIQQIIQYLHEYSKHQLRYIIGTSKEDGTNSRDHELAHAYYGTDELYKEQMDYLIDELPIRVRNALINYLSKSQYHDSVFKDEMQAYMATGLDEMDGIKLIYKYRTPFIEVFLQKERERNG